MRRSNKKYDVKLISISMKGDPTSAGSNACKSERSKEWWEIVGLSNSKILHKRSIEPS